MTNNPLGQINTSGFLFQIAVEDAIQRSADEHGWGIVAHEVPWFDEYSGDDRFVDLVLQHDDLTVVVECKRPRDSEWVFLVPDWTGWTDPNLEHDIRCRWVRHSKTSGKASRVDRVQFNPGSPHAEFCVMRGEGANDRSMLEHTASRLCRAADFLAGQELERLRRANREGRQAYIPVIVTSASLSVCAFSPKAVSLQDGKLTDASVDSAEFVRFHKSLTSSRHAAGGTSSLAESTADSSRSVIVTTGCSVESVLGKLKVWARRKQPPWAE